MSGFLRLSSAAVNAEQGALLEGELPTICLDFKPVAPDEDFHEAAVYTFFGEERARRLAVCWNTCVGVSTERLEGDWKEGYEPWGHVQHLLAQRDQLLAALQGLIEMNSPLAGGPSHGELVEEWESEKRAGNLAAEYHLAALAAVAAAKGGAA